MQMLRMSIAVAVVAVWSVRPAHATCIRTSDGCSVCCPPGGPCSSNCSKQAPAEGRLLEVLAGGGGELDPLGGTGVLGVGVSWSQTFDPRSLEHGDQPVAAWCAPILCGIVGIGDIPRGAWIGNRRGAQLRAWLTADDVTVSVRPVFRAQRGRWRTASVLGAALPELGVGVRTGDLSAIWSPYPLVLRATRHIELELEPVRIGVRFADSQPHLVLGVAASLIVTR